MVHSDPGQDAGALEPLLPVLKGARVADRLYPLTTSPNMKYTNESPTDDWGPSPKPTRETYIRRLGYTPLIFRVGASAYLLVMVTVDVDACHY